MNKYKSGTRRLPGRPVRIETDWSIYDGITESLVKRGVKVEQDDQSTGGTGPGLVVKLARKRTDDGILILAPKYEANGESWVVIDIASGNELMCDAEVSRTKLANFVVKQLGLRWQDRTGPAVMGGTKADGAFGKGDRAPKKAAKKVAAATSVTSKVPASLTRPTRVAKVAKPRAQIAMEQLRMALVVEVSKTQDMTDSFATWLGTATLADVAEILVTNYPRRRTSKAGSSKRLSK